MSERAEPSRQVLAEFPYEPASPERGYAGQTLYVNLSNRTISTKAVTEEMVEKFIGGRGFGLWYLWHGVNDDTRWDDPENEIVISSGPCGGITQYPGSGKSLVVSISPLTDVVIDSNVGGHFGPLLKFAGFDALEIQGKADQDVVLFIDGTTGRVTIEDGSGVPVDAHKVGHWLIEDLAETEEDRYTMSVVAAGSGADHSRFGCLNFSFYDRKRKEPRFKQAGRGGIGTVFRDKGIKAVVVKSGRVRGDSNQPADVRRISRVGSKINRTIREYDDVQCRMGRRGTSYLVQIMNDYDLLPTHNFQYGSHRDAPKINGDVWEDRFTQGMPDGCWLGCTLKCSHAVDGYELRTGPYKGDKVIVDGPEYETIAGVGSNCGIFEPWAVLELNFYCDTYGLDTISFGTATAFVMECYERGILDKEKTGGLELEFGNAEAALELLHQVGRGEGFGLVFGQGIRRMKEIFAEEFGADRQFLQDIGMEAKGLEYSEYVTKESLAQQGGYGLSNKGPQHDEAWLIFMDQVNNQIPTFEDKAEALHYFPMWRTWFGLCGFCKVLWNDIVPPDNDLTDEPAKIPEHVQNYVEVFSGVTGREVTKEDLITQSERIYQFQRVFNIRLGHGLRDHDAVPYRSQGPVTTTEYESRGDRYDRQLEEELGLDPAAMTTEEKVAALRVYREDQYEKLIDAVYKRRGWTENGVPKLEILRGLGIDYPDVVAVVEPHL
ncbi:MAG: aldehyde ferredoxin oxidoreductase C-terminal domain-containing protein [Anaerolineae bacterium]